MQPSPNTIGLVMIGLAVMVPAIAIHEGGGAPTALSAFAAVPLLVGGVAMLARRRWSLVVAMAGGAFTALGGAVGLAMGRAVGLPIKPLVTLVIGLYVCFRIFIARSAIVPPPPRSSIADELAESLARPTDRSSSPPSTDASSKAGVDVKPPA
jgi:hypothetical protein